LLAPLGADSSDEPKLHPLDHEEVLSLMPPSQIPTSRGPTSIMPPSLVPTVIIPNLLMPTSLIYNIYSTTDTEMPPMNTKLPVEFEMGLGPSFVVAER
jgi:hypothetical protein